MPPLFVSVKVCALALAPTPVAGNVIVDTGETDTPAGAIPVPLSVTVCVRYASAIVCPPICAPTLFGTNATCIAQLACPFSEFPQPFTTVKSPLVICPAIRVSAASPEFVTVMVCTALGTFNCWPPKLKARLERASVAGSRPVPLSAAVCVPALSVTVNVPDLVPEAVGRNTTETVHPELGGNVVPHVFAVMAKSPITAELCSVTDVEPVFETVMFCSSLLAPTLVPEYVTATGVNSTLLAAVAVPLRLTVACPPTTFPYTVNSPIRVPVADGRNFTCTVQLD